MTPGEALAQAHRREWAAVLAATVRLTGDLDMAEDCVQEAYTSAAASWPEHGVPDRPGAWLTTVARRKALDRLRHERVVRRTLPLLVEPVEASPLVDPDQDRLLLPDRDYAGRPDAVGRPDAANRPLPDDTLRLVFICAHPALSRDAQVALTLRLVCGITTADLARAFLVSEATMAARITRAKRKISQARIPFRLPPPDELPRRLEAVLAVVHLLFTTGHTAPSGDALVRPDLVEAAIGLGRTLVALLPAEPEVRGLLALQLLLDARRATRTDDAGRLLLLEQQDRDRWNQISITEGLRYAAEALAVGRPGPYALQAAIAGVHAVAPTWEATDWPRIRSLYDALLRLRPSPVVALNRAVAVAFTDGPAAGLTLVEELAGDDRLAGYPYLPATRADLLRRLGRPDEAAPAYREAIALSDNAAEREFLRARLAALPSTPR